MAKPGRHVEGASTRERVLEAAADLIARQGYAATSMAQISQKSGANPASIYWAFGSKEGMFAAVMERAAENFFARLTPIGAGDPWAWIAALAEHFADGPEFLRLLLVLSLERREGDPAVLEAARRIRARAVDALSTQLAPRLEVADPFRRRGIAERLARLALMLFDGAFVASQVERDTTDVRRAFATIAVAVEATAARLVQEQEPAAPPKKRAAARKEKTR
jgi:AcrR family transcriptional regulator